MFVLALYDGGDEAYSTILSIKIPDDDLGSWIKVLREGGFDDEEIDNMLWPLNNHYGEAQLEAIVEKKMKKLEATFVKHFGKLKIEHKESMHDTLLENLRNLPAADLLKEKKQEE